MQINYKLLIDNDQFCQIKHTVCGRAIAPIKEKKIPTCAPSVFGLGF